MRMANGVTVYRDKYGVRRCSTHTRLLSFHFASLVRLEKILEGKEYLIGDCLTEADVRLFVAIVHFDPVYVGHFKCNMRTIRDGYPAIYQWVRMLYWAVPAFEEATN